MKLDGYINGRVEEGGNNTKLCCKAATICGNANKEGSLAARCSALNKNNENRNSKVWKKLTTESKDGGAQGMYHAQDHEQPDLRAGVQARCEQAGLQRDQVLHRCVCCSSAAPDPA
jgi:hypothetical protein